MSNPRHLACLAGLCLSLATYAAAPPVESAESKAMRALIDEMGDRDWVVRDRAERKLTKMGLPALKHLRRAAGHLDPEVRRRVLRMLPGLEHAVLVTPKRYTFSVENQNITGVVMAMRKATGYRIENNSGMLMAPAAPGKAAVERKFTYHFRDATYWEIMDRLTRDTGLYPNMNWGDDTIRLYQGGTVPAITGYDGGLRYSANSFQLYRNVDLSRPASAVAEEGGATPRSESLTLNFTLYAEPRMPFLGVDQPRLEIARDDRRGSMLPTPTGAEGGSGRPVSTRSYYSGGHKQHQMQVSVYLTHASVGAKRLERLRGVVPVTLLVEQKPMVVTENVEKAKGLKKEIEGVEFNITSFKAMPNNQCQVAFTVTNRGNPGDYNFMNTLYQRIELYDDKGQRFQNYGSSWGGGPGGGVINLTLTFGHFGGKIGPPRKFVYQHWVTKQHDMTFDFKDVPLP